MSDCQLIKGKAYRVLGFHTSCNALRTKFSAMGFITGSELMCVHSWFFKRYWMIVLGTQQFGMYYKDLGAIKLSLINHE